LHAKTGLLRGQLSGLLLKAALRLSTLTKQAADALHQLRLLARLAGLRLLELSHLHGGLSIEASFLEALLRGLKAKLALLTGELALQACLLSSQLSGLLAKACLLSGSPDLTNACLLQHACRLHSCLLVGHTVLPLHGLVSQRSLLLSGKVLLADSQAGLLIGHCRLERRLLVHTGSLQTIGLLLHASLLLVAQVCKGSLQPCLGPQLLYPKLRSKVLLADSQSCLLVRQSGLERRLLVHTGGLQPVGFLLNTGLLLGIQVSQRRLHSGVCAKLLRLHLSAQVLLPH
jgi:hypothetical protein